MSTKTIKEKLNVRVQVILQMIYHWENLLLYKLHLWINRTWSLELPSWRNQFLEAIDSKDKTPQTEKMLKSNRSPLEWAHITKIEIAQEIVKVTRVLKIMTPLLSLVPIKSL